jgi:outer membrane immunogenic protein
VGLGQQRSGCLLTDDHRCAGILHGGSGSWQRRRQVERRPGWWSNRTPNWVVGVEGDFDWADIHGKSSVSTSVSPFVPFTTTAEQKLEDFSTVRARVGYVWDRTVFYGTGGVAFGRTELNTAVIAINPPSGCGPNGLCAVNSTSEWRTGWTAGAGFEWAFAPSLSVKAEYLYYDLGSHSHNANDPVFPNTVFGSSADFRGSLVRAGLNYRLGGP